MARFYDPPHERTPYDGRRLAKCVTTNGGQMNYHPCGKRSFTPRERARLQTFRNSYEFVGTVGEVNRQVGNAVPPAVWRRFMAVVASTLRDFGHGRIDASGERAPPPPPPRDPMLWRTWLATLSAAQQRNGRARSPAAGASGGGGRVWDPVTPGMRSIRDVVAAGAAMEEYQERMAQERADAKRKAKEQQRLLQALQLSDLAPCTSTSSSSAAYTPSLASTAGATDGASGLTVASEGAPSALTRMRRRAARSALSTVASARAVAEHRVRRAIRRMFDPRFVARLVGTRGDSEGSTPLVLSPRTPPTYPGVEPVIVGGDEDYEVLGEDAAWA
jgi:hypothetical protein